VRRETPTVDDSSWSALVGGIFTDIAHLVASELEIAKHEVREEIRSAKTFFALLVLGLWVAGMGLFMILMMLAYLLNKNTVVPLWGCFGIVGGTTFLVGAGFLFWANNKKRGIDHLIPQRAAEAVKEDIGWIRSSIKTSRIGSKLEQH